MGRKRSSSTKPKGGKDKDYEAYLLARQATRGGNGNPSPGYEDADSDMCYGLLDKSHESEATSEATDVKSSGSSFEDEGGSGGRDIESSRHRHDRSNTSRSGSRRRESSGSRHESESVASHSTFGSYHRPRHNNHSSSRFDNIRGRRYSKDRSKKSSTKSRGCCTCIVSFFRFFEGVHFKTLMLSLVVSIVGTVTVIRVALPELFDFSSANVYGLKGIMDRTTTVRKSGVRGTPVMIGEELMNIQDEIDWKDLDGAPPPPPKQEISRKKSRSSLEAQYLEQLQYDNLQKEQQQMIVDKHRLDPQNNGQPREQDQEMGTVVSDTNQAADIQNLLMQLQKQKGSTTEHKPSNTSPEQQQLMELQNQFMQLHTTNQVAAGHASPYEPSSAAAEQQGLVNKQSIISPPLPPSQQEHQQQQLVQQLSGATNQVTDLKSQLMQLQQTRQDGVVDEATQQLMDQMRDASDEAAELQKKLMQLQLQEGGTAEHQQQVIAPQE